MSSRSEASRNALKEHFNNLGADIKAVEEKAGPLRAQRDEIVRAMQPQEDEARALLMQIKEAEEGLYEMKMEYADLSRALGGKHMNAEGVQQPDSPEHEQTEQEAKDEAAGQAESIAAGSENPEPESTVTAARTDYT
jgi:hypothetical protein